MWRIFIIIFGVLFGIFMPRLIYENYTDTDLEDSTYEEDSYVNSEDSTYEEYSYADSEDSVYGDYPYPDPEYAAGRGNLKTYNNKDYDPTKTDWENYGDTGSIVGREAGINFRDCDATVVYKKKNGRFGSIRYFSHRYQLIAETPVVEAFTLTYENGVITRDEVEGYDNLGWHIERDGSLLLDRAAEGELQLPAEYTYPDTSIWLEAYINGTYIRVSNIIEVP